MIAPFINCTPHPVTILAEDGSVVATFPPSGTVPRISELVDATGDVAGVQRVHGEIASGWVP